MFEQFRFKTALGGLALALVTTTTMADSLYSQAPIPDGDGRFSHFTAGAQNADNFVLSASATITDLRWWGSYDGVDTDNFLVRILSNSAGSPGTISQTYINPVVTRSSTSLTDIAGSDVYQYDLDVLDFGLTAGTYYVSVMNDTTTANWYWLFGTGGDSQSWSRGTDVDPWAIGSDDFALEILGTVRSVPTPTPEPETLVLLLMGFAAMGAGRLANKRRRDPSVI